MQSHPNHTHRSSHRAWLRTSAALGCAVLASALVSFPAPVQAIPVDDQPIRPAATTVKAARLVCPPAPNVRYVGVPWVPREKSGCASLDRWWTVLEAIPEPVRRAVPTPSPKSTPDTKSPERPCFIWRSNWNEALDAPEPTCPLAPED